jgi:hypothetical protein
VSAAIPVALGFTVVLLVITAYFVMGSVPLLVLKHDTPLDSRFVRSFFNTYYLAAMLTAGATAVSYAVAGRPAFAAGAAGLAILAAVLRRSVIVKMDALQPRIQTGNADAIADFRRTHITAIVINLVQLAIIVWSLIALKL